jgi:phospholipid/cholesterol/gamma-HCH transport system ATP-binding protein
MIRKVLMGIGTQVDGSTQSFGSQRIWEDVTFDLPAGEVSVLLGQAVGRRQARVREVLHTLPPAVQEAIRDDLEGIQTSSAPLPFF